MNKSTGSFEISVIPLPPVRTACPYFADREAVMERALLVEVDIHGIGLLLKQGYRHFGRFLFRPACPGCGRCLPVRIPIADFTLSASDRRTLNRIDSSGLVFEIDEDPMPDRDLHSLYLSHKKRFPFPAPAEEEDYDSFVESFFTPTPGAKVLKLMDGERTVAMSHIDISLDTCSAVYCYWDMSYARFSPGKAAILMETVLARRLGLKYLCLGYLVEENAAMAYKKNYVPLQASTRPGLWNDWIDADGSTVSEMEEHPRFIVPEYS